MESLPTSRSTGRKRVPVIARRLSDLIKTSTCHLRKTSIVVTHDMRVVERLADMVIFCIRAEPNISPCTRASSLHPIHIRSNS